MNPSRPMALALVAALGCVDAYVDLPIGPVNVTIALPVQGVPQALLSPDGTLRRVACSASAPCPQASVADVTVRCLNDVCALSAFTLRASSSDIDLSSYSTYRDYADALDDLTVQAVSIQLTGARVGNAVGPLDVWWTGASGSAGVPEQHLGSALRVSLMQREVTVPVTVDAAGVRALIAQVRAGNTRFRLRVEGPLDVGAGALPEPQVNLAVTLLLHLHGAL